MTRTRRFQTSTSTALRGIAGLASVVVTVSVVSALGQLADGYQAEAVMASQAASVSRYASTAGDPAAQPAQRVLVTAERSAIRGG